MESHKFDVNDISIMSLTINLICFCFIWSFLHRKVETKTS